jgi:dihydrofolate reductase
VGKLIYSAITSLDGYIADSNGNFEWAAPDEEVHAFVNDLERPIGTYLYGRRMYETMVFWETAQTQDEPAVFGNYAAIWQAAEKVVFSRTLTSASSARTRVEREFDVDSIRQMKAEQPRDLSIGGADLAGHALRAGLVDELQVFLTPIIVGGGNHWLQEPAPTRLRLVDQHTFNGGVVFLRYQLET